MIDLLILIINGYNHIRIMEKYIGCIPNQNDIQVCDVFFYDGVIISKEHNHKVRVPANRQKYVSSNHVRTPR